MWDIWETSYWSSRVVWSYACLFINIWQDCSIPLNLQYSPSYLILPPPYLPHLRTTLASLHCTTYKKALSPPLLSHGLSIVSFTSSHSTLCLHKHTTVLKFYFLSLVVTILNFIALLLDNHLTYHHRRIFFWYVNPASPNTKSWKSEHHHVYGEQGLAKELWFYFSSISHSLTNIPLNKLTHWKIV